MNWPWYWDWYWTFALIGTSLVSFSLGYYERKLTMKRVKGVRFYKPKDNLCAVYDRDKKLTYQQHSVETADILLKTLNQLYYKEEISRAKRKGFKSKSEA